MSKSYLESAKNAYQMLGNENLWQATEACHRILADAKIPHAICGGVAVCLHGYQRNTVDADLIINATDSPQVKALLTKAGLQWSDETKEFRTRSGVAVQFLIANEPAGNNSSVRIPEPTGDLNVEEIEGLPVVRLSRLIEMKIACGSGNIRRTHKDFADVVELIAVRNLDGSFVRFLHKSVRSTFRELRKNARG